MSDHSTISQSTKNSKEEMREGGSQEDRMTGMTQEGIVQSDGDVGGKKEVTVLTNH